MSKVNIMGLIGSWLNRWHDDAAYIGGPDYCVGCGFDFRDCSCDTLSAVAQNTAKAFTENKAVSTDFLGKTLS